MYQGQLRDLDEGTSQKNMKNKTILTVVACLAMATGAHAGTITITPLSQNITGSGQTVVTISVPPEIVSAYDLQIQFNPGLLTPTSVLFGSELGAPVDSIQTFSVAGGRLDISEFSFLSDSTLISQPLSFVLFTINWDVVAAGTSDLTWTRSDAYGAGGLALPTLTATGASITGALGDGSQVPEPSTGVLLLIASCAVPFLVNRRKK